MISKQDYEMIKENEDSMTFLSHPELSLSYNVEKLKNPNESRMDKKLALISLFKNKDRFMKEELVEKLPANIFIDIYGDLDFKNKVSGLSFCQLYLPNEIFAVLFTECFMALKTKVDPVLYPLYLGDLENIRLMEFLPEDKLFAVLDCVQDSFCSNGKFKEDRIRVFTDMIEKIETSDYVLSIFNKVDVSPIYETIESSNQGMLLRFFELKKYKNLEIAKRLLNLLIKEKMTEKEDVVILNAMMSNKFTVSFKYFERFDLLSEYKFDLNLLKQNKKQIALHLKPETTKVLKFNHKDDNLEKLNIHILTDNEISLESADKNLIIIKEFDLFRLEVAMLKHKYTKKDFFNYLRNLNFDVIDENGRVFTEIFDMVSLTEKI